MANKRKSSKGGDSPAEEASDTAAATATSTDADRMDDTAPAQDVDNSVLYDDIPAAPGDAPGQDTVGVSEIEQERAQPHRDAVDAVDAPQSAEADDSLPREQSDKPDAEPETGSEPEAETKAPAPEKRASAMPAVFGGVVAAAIGFAAAYAVLPQVGLLEQPGASDALRADLETQAGAIETLRAQLEAGVAPLEQGVADMALDITALADATSEHDARLSELEARPAATGGNAGIEDVAALQSAIDAQAAEIAALQNEEAAREAAARDSAAATLRRAALTQIRTAMDTGSGFAPALADLEATGIDAPGTLRVVADEGAPSLGALQDSFPMAARAALAAARAGGESPEDGGVMSFLSTQLGARSLEPRDGPGTDAVLSRAEAALREGRLGDALSEIGSLPGAPSAEMDAWASSAQTRLEATEAVSALAAEVN